MKRLLVGIFIALVALIVWGCGGSSGSGSTGERRIQIHWPTRSKDVLQGLSSSLSAKLTFSLPNGDSPVGVLVDRDQTKLNTYTATYPLPGTINPTLTKLVVTFYSKLGGLGVVTGNASATVNLAGSNAVLNTITLESKVATVVVSDRTLPVSDQQTQLEFTAKDAGGEIVAVEVGGAIWAATEGDALIHLTKAGIVIPSTAGDANVAATIDGVTSPVATIHVVNASFDVTYDEIKVPGYDIRPRGISDGSVVADVYEAGVFYFNNPIGTVALVKPQFQLLSPVPVPPGQTNTLGNTTGAIEGNNVVGTVVGQYLHEPPNPNFYRAYGHAALWENGGFRDLNPPGTKNSYAFGISGDFVGGQRESPGVQGANATYYPDLATVWRRSGSTFIDMHPDSQFASRIKAIGGSLFVGSANGAVDLQFESPIHENHAAAWTSASPFSFVDIHPSIYSTSEAIGVSGGKIVGNAKSFGTSHAILWKSPSPTDYVKLSGDDTSIAYAIKGNFILGAALPENAAQSGMVIWNATSHKVYHLPFKDGSNNLNAVALDLTDAGIDVLAMENGAAKTWLIHVPSSLLP